MFLWVWSVHLGYYLSVNPAVGHMAQFGGLAIPCKNWDEIGASKRTRILKEYSPQAIIGTVVGECERRQFAGLVGGLSSRNRLEVS